MDTRREHWTTVYADKAVDELTWYQRTALVSTDLIEATDLGPHDPILDAGGGGSVLVDELLTRGFDDITVLDISVPAIGLSRRRLGTDASRVTWIEGDVLADVPDRGYRLWHDRALLHFFTDPSDVERYTRVVDSRVAQGGWAIVATFGPDGPTTCSGLPVVRYDEDTLQATFGGFVARDFVRHLHETPWGGVQQILFGLFERR